MVSIVMPAFNEAPLIERSVTEWYEGVVAKLDRAELIVIDDCSIDGTGEILRGLALKMARLRIFRTDTNAGHGRALRLGFRQATQPYVFQTDSDRQIPSDEFWKFWKAREEFDLIAGVRVQRADGTTRALITFVMRVLNLAMWQTWIRDANCPFKLMRREKLEQALRSIPENSFIPMVLVSVLARKLHWKILEVPVTHLPRASGRGSLRGLAKWVRVGTRCLGDLWAVRVKRNQPRMNTD